MTSDPDECGNSMSAQGWGVWDCHSHRRRWNFPNFVSFSFPNLSILHISECKNIGDKEFPHSSASHDTTCAYTPLRSVPALVVSWDTDLCGNIHVHTGRVYGNVTILYGWVHFREKIKNIRKSHIIIYVVNNPLTLSQSVILGRWVAIYPQRLKSPNFLKLIG